MKIFAPLKNRWTTLVAVLCFIGPAAPAQKTIRLANPSFEDAPGHMKVPAGWSDCGHRNESPPDVQPGQYDVETPAEHGRTYLGLVVRDNNTWEAVAQHLMNPLEAGAQYSLQLSLARSDKLSSMSRRTDELANYNTPARLIVWGGTGLCETKEILFETPLIEHTDWQSYTLALNPKEGSYTHVMFQAYYETQVEEAYNGNLLIDNCSDIVRKDKQ